MKSLSRSISHRYVALLASLVIVGLASVVTWAVATQNPLFSQTVMVSWQLIAIILAIMCSFIITLLFVGAAKLDRDRLTLDALIDVRTKSLLQVTKRAERDKARLRKATEAAQIGLWTWNLKTDSLEWDERMFELYGIDKNISLDSINFNTWESRIFPEDLEESRQKTERLLREGGSDDFDFRIIKPNGEIRYIEGSAYTEKDDSGQATHVVGLNRDVTEVRRSQEDLKEAQRLAKVGSWYHDIKRNKVVWSEALYRIFGMDPSLPAPDMIQQQSMYTLASWQVLTTAIDKIVSDGTPYEIELEVVRPDGLRRWIISRGERVLDLNDEPVALRGTASDISDLKYQQKLLRDAREEAEAANRAKDHFLSLMSHEIRTPLNSIVGTSYLLSLENLTERQSQDLQIINASSKSLLSLINDVLDFSKIEAGGVELDLHPFSLQELLYELHLIFARMAEDKGVDLIISAPPDSVADWVVGDSSRIKQILINLLSNALKFTAQGSVELKISEYQERSSSKVFLRFQVIDSGIGIEPNDIKKLFTPFVQAVSSTSRVYGGTGLGLSIAKRLIGLMDGSISLESEMNVGTSVTIQLPLAIQDERARSRSSSDGVGYQPYMRGISQRLQGARILLVEDSEINLRVTERILKHEGVEVSICKSGGEALEILSKDPGFNLVLMDLEMPGIDGIEATEQIREHLSQSLPILALTAGASSTVKSMAMSSGMNGFLTKPIDPMMLLGAISEYID